MSALHLLLDATKMQCSLSTLFVIAISFLCCTESSCHGEKLQQRNYNGKYKYKKKDKNIARFIVFYF